MAIALGKISAFGYNPRHGKFPNASDRQYPAGDWLWGHGAPDVWGAVVTALFGAGFCSLSGMLPDIDSGPGRPVREITTFMAAVIPTMLLGRLFHVGVSPSRRFSWGP